MTQRREDPQFVAPTGNAEKPKTAWVWRDDLDRQIATLLQTLRNRLTTCIGCASCCATGSAFVLLPEVSLALLVAEEPKSDTHYRFVLRDQRSLVRLLRDREKRRTDDR